MKKVRSLAKNGLRVNLDSNKIGSGKQDHLGLPKAFWQLFSSYRFSLLQLFLHSCLRSHTCRVKIRARSFAVDSSRSFAHRSRCFCARLATLRVCFPQAFSSSSRLTSLGARTPRTFFCVGQASFSRSASCVPSSVCCSLRPFRSSGVHPIFEFLLFFCHCQWSLAVSVTALAAWPPPET